MLKPKLLGQLESYASYHRHPLNQLCHKFGIPLVIVHVVAMLDWVKLFTWGTTPVTLLMAMFPFVALWYLSLDVVVGGFTALCYVLAAWIGRHMSVPAVLVLTVIAWATQLLGHIVWEKRSPAFLTNVTQLFIGPLYLSAQLLGKWSPPKNAK